MELHIIRHGETENNLKGIVQGSSVNDSLNLRGKKQAEAFYQFYCQEAYDYIYSSTLKRAMETVDIWKGVGVPIIHTSLINEINWGIHEGKKIVPEMTERYNKLMVDWYAGKMTSRIAGGESLEELYERLNAFIRHLRKLNAQKILICTHGRTMRALITLLLRLPQISMDEFNHTNTSLYIVSCGEKESILKLKNDTRHLKGIV